MAKKIKVTGKTLRKVDFRLVAQRLGAKIVNVPQLTKEEAENGEYVPLGSPVMMSAADKLSIYHLDSSMLQSLGKSLDEVVGYRVLDADEEKEFRQQCAEEKNDPGYLHMPVVRYYGRKPE
ncbi:MAG: hypothetical protein AABW53_01820 [Nanoarchaeota archaeon]